MKQFRYPMQEILLELPAGKIELGEAPEVTAARELEEEVGYSAGSLKKMAEFYSTPGFCDEKIHLYLGEDLRPCQGGGDHDEELEVLTFTLPELLELIRTQKLPTPKRSLAFNSWLSSGRGQANEGSRFSVSTKIAFLKGAIFHGRPW